MTNDNRDDGKPEDEGQPPEKEHILLNWLIGTAMIGAVMLVGILLT